MPRLRIEHLTEYQYQSDVTLAQHLAYLRPRSSSWQSVLSHELLIDPKTQELKLQTDAFDNERYFFSLTHPHRSLRVQTTSDVENTARYAGFDLSSTPAWEDVRDSMVYALDQPFVWASQFVWPSPYIGWHQALKDYALQSFSRNRPIGIASMELCQRIYEDFKYESGATEIHTPLEQAFSQRAGVCQDFAHIMIGCLRAVGLAGKYVSGYLLTKPAPGIERLRGADASHAWVSVYCPNAPGQWLELDPTNNVVADLDHVCLALGRDFGDVSPLRGVIRGGGQHQLAIAVTVEPIETAQTI